MSDHQTKAEAVQTDPPGRQPRKASNRRVWLAWAAVIGPAALIAGFAFLQLSKTGANPSRLARAYGFSIGDFRAEGRRETRPAPALVGEAMDGSRLTLSEYRGKVVVLNLWASWCGPCRKEQPIFERLWREYRDRGVQFIGLNVRDNKAAASSFIDEFQVTYPSFFDPSSALTFELGVQVLPTTFVVDPSGGLFFRFTGTVDEPLLRDAVDAALLPVGGSSGG